ncbi:DinB family protein [Alkalicoccus daliensis]|uniref:DinB superfamily protein n=1 Tax=Alkalicoccus daliensis TaxID=745820 RepID=A0A1H0HHZ1_9BACI|nr:DinB family protein [Alkalicoccus daliensis]SDO18829.1 DinB superfamily protein [Alkalicoccus daliensis]
MSKVTAPLENMKSFTEKLKMENNNVLNIPVKPGKWSTREIIGHLYYWDSYISESIVPFLNQGRTLPPFPNHNVFNRAAVAALEGRSAGRIIDSFIEGRIRLIEQLEAAGHAAEVKLQGAEETLTVHKIINIFSSHDSHHQKQIEEFLETYSDRG